MSFEKIEPLVAAINFDGNQAKLSDAATVLFDRAGQIIRQNPNLRVEIGVGKDENESDMIIEERAKSMTNYLASKWQIAPDRLITSTAADLKRGAILRIKLNEEIPAAKEIKK